MRISIYLGILVVLTLGLVAAACGDGGGGGQPATPAVEGTPTPSGDAATPVSDGEEPEGKIAFVSFDDGNQEIYVMDSDGSDKRNITDDPATDFDPDWSPDGKQIAFVSDRSGQVAIYVMDADGSDVRQLTPDGSGGISPRWSRDGTQIAFSQSGLIVVIDADGSNLRVVLETGPQETAPDCMAGSFPGGWSPDDDAITYYSASVSRQEGQVCTVKVVGSEVEVVVAEPGVYNVEPIYSPDGRYIVYRAIRDGVHDIWVIDLEKDERTNLTDDPDLDIEPDWSPDGEWIVFGSLRQGEPNFDIFIMRRDGSDVRRLTDNPSKEAYPVWAP